MLEIKNLQASINEKEILKGLNLIVNPGEVHAIMGPNGSGKSTLANVITGRDAYDITDGSIDFLNQDLLELAPDERARLGIFLAFQYPVEIPGVTTTNFMKAAINERRRHLGEEPMKAKPHAKVKPNTKAKRKFYESSSSSSEVEAKDHDLSIFFSKKSFDDVENKFDQKTRISKKLVAKKCSRYFFRFRWLQITSYFFVPYSAEISFKLE